MAASRDTTSLLEQVARIKRLDDARRERAAQRRARCHLCDDTHELRAVDGSSHPCTCVAVRVPA